MNRLSRWPLYVLALATAAYLVCSFSYLSVFPPVGEDEPWIAAAPYKLATQGVYGSDLFAGYAGVERHDYQRMPLYPMLEAGVFWLFGIGVVQMRLLSVAFGAALLLLVFLTGRMIGGSSVGAIAVVLMLWQRVTDGPGQIGILLLDRARVNRNDIAVPVFGLLAWLLFERADRQRAVAGYLAAGAAVGCASLSHLYGGFWLPALAAVVALRHGWWMLVVAGPAMLAGVLIAWIPWLLYIGSGWSDYLEQMRFLGPRFQVLNPRFYVDNIFSAEGPIGLVWAARTISGLSWSRAGTWLMLCGVPAALVLLAREARRSASPPAVAAVVIVAVQLLLFLALIRVKTLSYMIAIWPLVALLLAWLLAWAWRQQRVARAVAVIVVVAIMLEGSARLVASARAAERVTSPDFYAEQIARCIPEGARVVGFQHYWVGLRAFEYRTWLLPLTLANPLTGAPIPFDEALERVAPDVLLLDRHMRDLLRETIDPNSEYHHVSVGFERYRSRHRLELACVIRDRTYGTMEVYRVQ